MLSEQIVQGIAEEKEFDETKQKAILDTLLRPHKHRHRKGQKKKNDDQTKETSFGAKVTSTPKSKIYKKPGDADDTQDDHHDTSRLVRFKEKITGR